MSILNLDDVLGASLSATEAAPDFITLENGVFDLKVTKVEAKVQEVKDKAEAIKNNKPTSFIKINFTYEVLAVHDQEGQPIKVGSLTSEGFMATEQGLPYFKARVRDIAMATGAQEADIEGLSIKEAMAAAQGLEFRVNAKTRTTKAANGSEIVNVRFSNIRSTDATE